jgi:hypothetical protein
MFNLSERAEKIKNLRTIAQQKLYEENEELLNSLNFEEKYNQYSEYFNSDEYTDQYQKEKNFKNLLGLTTAIGLGAIVGGPAGALLSSAAFIAYKNIAPKKEENISKKIDKLINAELHHLQKNLSKSAYEKEVTVSDYFKASKEIVSEKIEVVSTNLNKFKQRAQEIKEFRVQAETCLLAKNIELLDSFKYEERLKQNYENAKKDATSKQRSGLVLGALTIGIIGVGAIAAGPVGLGVGAMASFLLLTAGGGEVLAESFTTANNENKRTINTELAILKNNVKNSKVHDNVTIGDYFKAVKLEVKDKIKEFVAIPKFSVLDRMKTIKESQNKQLQTHSTLKI